MQRITLPAVQVKGGLFKYPLKDGWYSITIDRPKRPRSTGKNSQNSKIWGMCGNIADQFKVEVNIIYHEMKKIAMQYFGYPCSWHEILCDWIPMSQKDATIEHDILFIKAIQYYADLNKLWLIEIIDGVPVKTLHGKKMEEKNEKSN